MFVTVVGGIVLGYSHCRCWFKQYDDAYITFRYAENLATGHGLVFNVGDATDSASSFFYTLLLAFCHLLGLHDLPVVATVIGVASAGVVCAVVYLGCYEWTGRPLLAGGLALTLGMHGLISGWAVSGMETLFFSALIALVVYRIFVLGRLGWCEALLVAVVDLTRFEGLIVAATWLLLLSSRYVAAGTSQRHSYMLQFTLVGGTFAAFLVFKHFTYGTFLPHAFELKRITTLYAPRPGALWEAWSTDSPVLLLLAVTGLFKLPKRRESAALVLYLCVSGVSVVVGPYADWARYSVHLLPIAVLLSCVSLATLMRTLPVLAFALCILIAVQAHSAFMTLRAGNEVLAFHQTCRLKIGDYLERNLDRTDVVLSSDIGAIAYAAPSVSFIDAVGLTSRAVLEARGRGESVDAVLLARTPTVIADTCHGSCTRASDFSAQGWLENQNYWLTPLPGYTYDTHLRRGKVLELCSSPDGLSFAATRFELQGAIRATSERRTSIISH